MTRLGAAKVGLFLRQQADELTRIWRLARVSARPAVFPGLLDGVVTPFFRTCGELLPQHRAPEEVWTELSGVVWWQTALAPAELVEEWAVMSEVVSAACEAVNAEPAVGEWLVRAIAACQTGTAALGSSRDQAPPGILAALVYSEVAPRRPAEKDGAA